MKIPISAVKEKIGTIGRKRLLAAIRAQLQLAKCRSKESRPLLRDYSANQTVMVLCSR
jgi:hypothetical protein